ncbi:MAG: hypothetical protein P4M00_18300 [Azospirillaceae bacterium]|nr:hypothetical protein [Azospirillaceae bacterium]
MVTRPGHWRTWVVFGALVAAMGCWWLAFSPLLLATAPRDLISRADSRPMLVLPYPSTWR